MARRISIYLYEHTKDAEISDILELLRANGIDGAVVEAVPLAQTDARARALDGFARVHGIGGPLPPMLEPVEPIASRRVDAVPGVYSEDQLACTCGGRGICTSCALSELRAASDRESAELEARYAERQLGERGSVDRSAVEPEGL